MSKTALVIIFNHNYEANIPKLENHYKTKFSEIFFLMPFYSGEKENVISVFGNSFYFGSYVSQASLYLLKMSNSDRFLFIGDDLILNPEIIEENVDDYFCLSKNMAFIPRLASLSERTEYWSHAKNAWEWNPFQRGIEVEKFIISEEEMFSKMSKFGSPSKKIPISTIYPKLSIGQAKFFTGNLKYFVKYLVAGFLGSLIRLVGKKDFNSLLPFYWSYSDIFIVPRKSFLEFSRILGLFSSTSLFVELAIPTALALSVEEIRTEDQLEYEGSPIWPNSLGIFEELQVFNLDFRKLLSEFPEKCLYLHPIKLSKWKNVNE